VAGKFQKPAGTEYLFKSVLDAEKLVPLCNSNVYTEDKNLVGKLKEVLGPVNEVVCISMKFIYTLSIVLLS